MRIKLPALTMLCASLSAAPALACSPSAFAAADCTAPLTIVSRSDGFVIVPQEEGRADLHARDPRSGLLRFGRGVWLDSAMTSRAVHAYGQEIGR